MNSRHRRLITGALQFCTLIMAAISVSCMHTEYIEQPLFTLHAVDISNFGTFNRNIFVDAACVEHEQELRCASDLAMPIADEILDRKSTRLNSSH